jgi:SET domain-containing protein
MYEIRDCSSGKGIFAKEKILKGTKIIIESPFLLVLNNQPFSSNTWKMTEMALWSNIDLTKYSMTKWELDDNDREDVLKLMKSFGKTQEEILTIYWKLATNNLTLVAGGNAMYDNLSFVNHSCDPNSKPVEIENHVKNLISTREILEGEEICIPYTVFSQKLPADIRKQIISAYHGFSCKCVKCETNTIC